MRILRLAAAALLATAVAGANAARAEGIPKMTPADPQPTGLQPGLNVKYAYPADVKSLYLAEDALGYGTKDGPPLVGFDYPDTDEGDKALTSDSPYRVVADISGYIRFDQPGIHQLEFWNNDGLRVEIGGVEVYEYDGRHPCETGGIVSVEAPAAGWYPLKALYFQRAGTSCLLLKTQPPGGSMQWADNAIFGR